MNLLKLSLDYQIIKGLLLLNLTAAGVLHVICDPIQQKVHLVYF